MAGAIDARSGRHLETRCPETEGSHDARDQVASRHQAPRRWPRSWWCPTCCGPGGEEPAPGGRGQRGAGGADARPSPRPSSRPPAQLRAAAAGAVHGGGRAAAVLADPTDAGAAAGRRARRTGAAAEAPVAAGPGGAGAALFRHGAPGRHGRGPGDLSRPRPRWRGCGRAIAVGEWQVISVERNRLELGLGDERRTSRSSAPAWARHRPRRDPPSPAARPRSTRMASRRRDPSGRCRRGDDAPEQE